MLSQVCYSFQTTAGQLLAVVYLEMKDDVSCRKALASIESSIAIQAHIKSIFLKLIDRSIIDIDQMHTARHG